MRYCEECGCYLPDGHTKCLACGYDEKSKVIAKPRPEYSTGAGGAGYSGAVYTPYRPDNTRLCYPPYYGFNSQRPNQSEHRAQYAQLNCNIAALYNQISTQQQCTNLVNNIGTVGYIWGNNE